jgi:hypothetical protein
MVLVHSHLNRRACIKIFLDSKNGFPGDLAAKPQKKIQPSHQPFVREATSIPLPPAHSACQAELRTTAEGSLRAALKMSSDLVRPCQAQAMAKLTQITWLTRVTKGDINLI